MELVDTVETVLRQKRGGIWSVSPDATVYDALVFMSEKEVGSVLVMSGNQLEGVFSERDYARKIILMGRASHETSVREVMSQPTTVTPKDTVSDCMRLMTDRRRRHLPVVDSTGNVIGVLSIGDLVNWIVSSHEKTIQHLHEYIAGAYPA